MYTESAEWYDLIYSFKDYESEAEKIISAIKSLHPACKSLLDIGCGTGEHHKYLKSEFKTDGLDLNERFIEIARQKNPEGRYYSGNMVQFDLKCQYDVVACLFSSIGYLKDLGEIISALRNFRKHLNPGGIIMIEPWFTKDTWHDGKVHMITCDKPDLKVTRINRSESSGDFSIINFHYLVGTPSDGVRHFTEKHELRMTSKDEFDEAFDEAGLKYTYDEEGLMGRGMYYASIND